MGGGFGRAGCRFVANAGVQLLPSQCQTSRVLLAAFRNRKDLAEVPALLEFCVAFS